MASARAFGGGASASDPAAPCRATLLSRTSATPMKDKMIVAALIARHGQTLPRWIISIGFCSTATATRRGLQSSRSTIRTAARGADKSERVEPERLPDGR